MMEVEDRTPRGKHVDKSLLQGLSEQLRVYMAQKGFSTIDSGTQRRAIAERIAEIKQESYEACFDNSCQIDLGKALAASHIFRTQITRFGKKCVLNAEMIDLKAEVTVTAASARGPCKPEGFLNMSERVTNDIVARMNR